MKNRSEASSAASKYLNDGEAYRNGSYKHPIKVENDDDDEVQITKTLYCPKPSASSNKENKPSFFGSLFSRADPKPQSRHESGSSDEKSNPYQYLSQIRGGNLRTRLHNTEKQSNSSLSYTDKPYLRPSSIPTKERNLASNFIFNKLIPFVSHLGLQLSKILPYVVIIIFTVIILQYVRMKLFTNQKLASSAPTNKDKFVPLTENRLG
jgi:hypothetical protein